MIRKVNARRDDVGRRAAQVRGGHAADRRGCRVRRRRRLPGRRRPRGDRAARARSHRVRARAARRRAGHRPSTGRRRSGVPGSSRSTSTASTRTTCAGARLGRRRDPRRAPLLPAADGDARRGGDEPRELLPVHDPRGDRPARRGPAQGPKGLWLSRSGTLDNERVRPALPRNHPRSLQEPARARGDGGRRRGGRGHEPALRRRGHDLRRVRRGRRDDRRRQVLRPRVRDQPGGDVDAHRDGQGPQRPTRSRRCRRRSCSRSSASR